jgi:hypothetical protein
MIYIIDKIRDYIEKGQYDDAINLLDLYRMTIESIGAVNYPYFRLISPNFEAHLYRQFKKWNNKQKQE